MKVLLTVPSKEPVKLVIFRNLVIHVLQVLFVCGVKTLLVANKLELLASLLILAIYSATPSLLVKHVIWFLDVDGVMMKRNALMLTQPIASLHIRVAPNPFKNVDLMELLL